MCIWYVKVSVLNCISLHVCRIAILLLTTSGAQKPGEEYTKMTSVT